MINRAQGTIEYLVIIAVVVVISLVVVGLFVNMTDSPSQEIIDSSDKLGTSSSGGISVVEAVLDVEGDSLIRLNNNSSDAITLTKITVGGVDNNFSEQLGGLDSKVFSLSSLNSSCPCVSGQKSVKCELKIIYTTQTGIIQTEYRTINAQCVNDSTPVNPDNVIDPVVSVVELGTLANPWIINTCQELQDMNLHLDGNYVLGNDVNCYNDTHVGGTLYNEGNGFNPIGYCDGSFGCDIFGDVPFTGNFNGNNKIISNLMINRSADGVGLFGFSSGNISNVGLVDININGNSRTGGLVGWQSSGIILNSYTTGSVNWITGGYGGVGGLVGWQSSGTSLVMQPRGVISNSYSTAIVLGNISQLGGLVGRQDNGEIINSYSTGTISGSTYVGGLVGYMGESDDVGAAITNSYSTGNVTCTNNIAGGLVGYQRVYSSNILTISNSFSTGIVTCPGDSAGGLVGKQYNGGLISNSYFDKTGVKLDNMCGTIVGGSGCDNEKGIDTTSQPNYFYSSSNAPLNSWPFSTIWVARNNNYPVLSWQTR